MKVYIAAALLPLLAINWLISRTNDKQFLLKYVFFFLSFIVVFHLLSKTNNRLNIYQLIADKQAKAISEAQGGIFLANDSNFIRLDYNDSTALLLRPDSSYYIKSGSRFLSWKLDNMKDTTFISNSVDSANYKFLYSVRPANTVILLHRLKPKLSDLLFSLPLAVWNVLIHHTLFAIHSWLHLAAVIENLWILLIFILSIILIDKNIFAKKEIIIFCLFFSILIFSLVGITTPVVGAMLRYRSIGMLFFIPMCLVLIDENKLKQFFSKKNLPE